MRKEQIGDATLYLADSLAVLPTLGIVGALVTDPPYSSGGRTAMERSSRSTSEKYQTSGLAKYFEDFFGDNRDQRSWIMWMSLWISLTLRITKPGGMLCLFSDWRQLPAATDALQAGGAIWRGIAVWDKKDCRPQPDRFRASVEYIVWDTNGARKYAMKDKDAVYLPGVFRYAAPLSSVRVHATQKPVALLEDLVQVARRGEVVLDPFMGSGTAGVACINQGRKFIGIEMSEHYFDVACKRIEHAVTEGGAYGRHNSTIRAGLSQKQKA